MASHDLSVFLEEFGATVNLTLPGIVSEKERLLLKLLMEGMSEPPRVSWRVFYL